MDIFTLSGLSRPGQELGAGAVDALLLAEYAGMVEGTIAKSSKFQEWLDWRPVRGTNTLTNYRVGEATLQALTPGANPQPAANQFDDVRVKVDTVMLSRNAVFTLEDLQSKFNARAELANEQGKKIGKFIDEVGLIKLIKTARIVSVADGGSTDLPDGWFSGEKYDLAGAGDETDSNKLQYGIEQVVSGIQEKDLDPVEEGMHIFVAPAQYLTLLRNDKLVDTQYSMGNGNYAQGMVLRSCGLPIVSTNRIPKAAVVGHPLSNAANSNGYDVSAAEAKAVAIIGAPRAILAGSTIPLTVEIWWDKQTKSWFIDSYLALGAAENNPAYAGVVNKA